MNKLNSRLRRSKRSRYKINGSGLPRLSVHRTNLHIYASIFDPSASKVLVSASSLESEVRKELSKSAGLGGNVEAASMIGKRVAEKAKKAGIDVEIVHSPATQIPADADIVVTHQGLAGVAKNAAPENSVLIQYVIFMNDPSLNKLIKDLSEGNTIISS